MQDPVKKYSFVSIEPEKAKISSNFDIKLYYTKADNHSGKGIHLKVEIEYNDIDTIFIHNPLYYIQFQLSNMVQTDIPLKRVAPVGLINRKEDIDYKTDFVFEISRISQNHANIDIQKSVNQKHIELNKGTILNYELILRDCFNPEINGQKHIE